MKLLILTCLFLMFTSLIYAEESPVITLAETVPVQQVGIEWTFELNENSIPENIKGFTLFQEGHEICFFPGVDTRSGTCSFYSYPGTYMFTLAVITHNGDLISPKSPNYNLDLPRTDEIKKTILQMKYTLN